MSDYEMKPNTITLFANNRTKDTQPLLRGDVCIDTRELADLIDPETGLLKLQISLWGKTGKQSGDKYWSGSVRRPFVKTMDEAHNDMPPASGEPVQYEEPAPETSGFDATESPTDDLPF